jgi:hypothetical protein
MTPIHKAVLEIREWLKDFMGYGVILSELAMPMVPLMEKDGLMGLVVKMIPDDSRYLERG